MHCRLLQEPAHNIGLHKYEWKFHNGKKSKSNPHGTISTLQGPVLRLGGQIEIKTKIDKAQC